MKKSIRVLPTVLALSTLFAVAAPSLAQTERLIIDNGNNAYSNEVAREHKQQWDETQSLRKKINTHNEKEFNKFDRAIDTKDACQQSLNLNAYWEPNSLRCLDRRTGRPVQP